MPPTATINDLTCSNCIWAHSGDENGVLCANVEPDEEQYIDRNPASFCKRGMWVINNLRSDIHCVMNRPNAINILARREM